jgi:hypothetical protein
MRLRPTQVFAWLLLAVHGFLVLWALVGFIELVAPSVPWPPVSNPRFPREVLILQWSLTLAAGVILIAGYWRRWARTPGTMAGIYVAMAVVCAVETFGYLEGNVRFVAMGLEYAAYVGISAFLFHSRHFDGR